MNYLYLLFMPHYNIYVTPAKGKPRIDSIVQFGRFRVFGECGGKRSSKSMKYKKGRQIHQLDGGELMGGSDKNHLKIYI